MPAEVASWCTRLYLSSRLAHGFGQDTLVATMQACCCL